jgi:hypothetical protein
VSSGEVTTQLLVVAAAFRLRQSTQAEACGYKIVIVLRNIFRLLPQILL